MGDIAKEMFLQAHGLLSTSQEHVGPESLVQGDAEEVTATVSWKTLPPSTTNITPKVAALHGAFGAVTHVAGRDK